MISKNVAPGFKRTTSQNSVRRRPSTEKPDDPDEHSDSNLLEAIRAGNIDAYGILFARYQSAAIRIAGRHTRDHQLALDAVHEAFTTILAAIKAGAGPVGSFGPYLYTCVTREVHRQNRRNYREVLVPELPEQRTFHQDLAEQLLATHLADAALHTAFLSLPLRWQTILWHIDIHAIPPKEAALIHGLTPNAVIALHRRAKNGLRQAFLQQQELAPTRQTQIQPVNSHGHALDEKQKSPGSTNGPRDQTLRLTATLRPKPAEAHPPTSQVALRQVRERAPGLSRISHGIVTGRVACGGERHAGGF